MAKIQPVLSFSTGKISKDFNLLNWVIELGMISKKAIELSFVRAERVPEIFTTELLSELKNFEKVYIHSPVKLNNKWVKYPSVEIEPFINKIKNLVDITPNITNVLFHPDVVDDFFYLNKLFGEKLSFENMDIKKSFGVTISDLENTFSKSPQAKWVCDINHIYTVDKSMNLSKEMHERFGDRLDYYHLSAVGTSHDLFINNIKEIEILNGIFNFEKPLIHEGFNSEKVIPYLLQDKKLIESWFINNN